MKTLQLLKEQMSRQMVLYEPEIAFAEEQKVYYLCFVTNNYDVKVIYNKRLLLFINNKYTGNTYTVQDFNGLISKIREKTCQR